MHLIDRLSDLIWGNGLVLLLLLTGLMFTVKLKVMQLRLPFFLLRKSKCRNNGIPQLRTVCMSLGAAMGTGNITGVAAALTVGGAGAVFWMWVSAFLGMALVYAENFLSVKYSRDTLRGPMAYLEIGLGCRRLACFFAVMCVLSAFGMGGMVQVSSFAESLDHCADIPSSVIAVMTCAVILIIIRGGAERIGKVSQFLLPSVSVLYALMCGAVLIKYHDGIYNSFLCIFKEAFGIKQAAGGITGYTLSKAVTTGVKRGIFSNEAGLGSSPILHSSAESDSPHTQGMWSMFEVFFDTMICCTLTAVTLLACGEKTVQGAFSNVFGNCSSFLTAAEMAVFAFCTLIGWYYCGESAFIYITDGKWKKEFSYAFAVTASLGAIISIRAVWTLSDIFNGLMAFPNIIAVILLRNKVRINTDITDIDNN